MRRFSINLVDQGYTLIELIIVIAITATLSTLVTVSFQRLRIDQRHATALNDLVSKLREIQSATLAGKVVNGVIPKDYDIEFLLSNPSSYRIEYITLTSPGPPPLTTTTTLETINFPPQIAISSLQVNTNMSRTRIRARVNSPFGRISSLKVGTGSCIGLSGANCTNENATIQINLRNQTTNRIRSVVIDGVSGRIYSQ